MKFNQHLKENTLQEADILALQEAKFNTKNMRKVSDLLARIASKKLGAKFNYAWDDNFKKSSGESGSGVRYMSQTGLQIRFNHVNTKNSFTVNSVDFWNHKDTLTEPSVSIFFKERCKYSKSKRANIRCYP